METMTATTARALRAVPPTPDVDAPTREARRLSTLLEVSQALSGTLNLKASLHRVLEILARHHGAVRGIVSILEENGDLRVEAADGIGDGSRLVNEKGVEQADGDGYYIRGGIIVVPKGGTIAPGTAV